MMQEKSILSMLTVSNRLRDILGTIVGWARVIAIVNFIVIPVKLYNGIQSQDIFSAIVTAVITLVMNIYLINFSIKVKRGIRMTEQEDFNRGMKDLRDYFKVVGIFIILLMLITVAGLLFVVSSASTRF